MNKRAYLATAHQCPRGSLDVVRLHRYFTANGWSVTDDPSEADLVVVGGCAFTLSVEDQSIHHLAEIKQLMRPGIPLVVGGCIAGINAARIVEAVDGTPADIAGGDQLDELISAQVPLRSIDDANSLDYSPDQPGQVIRSCGVPASSGIPSPSTFLARYAGWFRYGKPQIDFNSDHEKVFYIRVARGCLEDCTYCAIKNAVGKLRSKPMGTVIQEFEKGLREGHRLFYLLGEDVGAYGQDQDTSIIDLLTNLLNHEGDFQLVISDCNPRWLVKYRAEFLNIISTNRGRVRQIELPIQSGSTPVLARMGRRYSAEDAGDCVSALREAARSIRLKTHIIVGFPGETSYDFHETLQFMNRARFDCIASYVYSDRPGTGAIKLPNKVPALVKMLRYWRFNREVL